MGSGDTEGDGGTSVGAGVAFDAFSQVTGLFTQAVPKALAYARSIDEIADAADGAGI